MSNEDRSRRRICNSGAWLCNGPEPRAGCRRQGASHPSTGQPAVGRDDAGETQQSNQGRRQDAAAARYGVYTISWPKDAAERDQLASYAVVMVTVVTQTQAELPLQRAYLVAADGKETPLRQLNSWLGKIGPKTLTYTQLGQFRQDAFYTIPGAAVGRPGEVRLDFAINRVGFVFNDTATTAQDLGYKLEDPAPGAQPNSAVLRDMIKREFPGFPVPKL